MSRIINCINCFVNKLYEFSVSIICESINSDNPNEGEKGIGRQQSNPWVYIYMYINHLNCASIRFIHLDDLNKMIKLKYTEVYTFI